jgi:hypothetical protein
MQLRIGQLGGFNCWREVYIPGWGCYDYIVKSYSIIVSVTKDSGFAKPFENCDSAEAVFHELCIPAVNAQGIFTPDRSKETKTTLMATSATC